MFVDLGGLCYSVEMGSVWCKRGKFGIKKNLFYLRLGAYVIDLRRIYVDLAAPPQPSARLFLFSPLLPISFSGEGPQG